MVWEEPHQADTEMPDGSIEMSIVRDGQIAGASRLVIADSADREQWISILYSEAPVLERWR